MGSIIMIRNIYSFWYIIFVLFLFTYSCRDNNSDDNSQDNPLVQGDSSAIIFQEDTLWIPQQLYCHNGNDTWELADYNGAYNGGDYHVILLTWFASY